MNTCFIDLEIKADIFMRKRCKCSDRKFMLKKPDNH